MKKTYFKEVLILGLVFFISSFGFAQFEAGDRSASIDSAEKISLDLKGMDVVEVLKTLASKGDMNIVVGQNVRGRVTMFLKDVAIRDAFEIILAANDLASERRGDIIYVMTERDYEMLYGEKYGDKKEARIIQLRYAKASELGKVLNQIKTKIGRVIVDEGSNTVVIIDAPRAISQAVDLVNQIDQPTRTAVFELSYATAEDLKGKLEAMLTKGVGMMQIDERTNKIVVTDLESNIPKIEEVVKAFDDKLQQVLIEAKIVEITLSDRYRFGVDWEAVLKELEKEINIKSSFQLATKGTFLPGAEFVIGTLGSSDYAAMVQILKSVGDANVLSSPRITVLNNEEAKILVGSNEPYATNVVTQGTATTTTATNLTFLDVGVKLFVTPTINKDGFVTIKIKPEVSSKSGEYTYGSPSTTVPIVSTTQAETNVAVKDGTTIIIAGLIKDERTGTVNKIPILGDMPLFGHAFKKTDNTVAKKELVIFLTPHVISGETDYLEQPLSPPIGEEKFTVLEGAAFEKRTPRKMSPGYFKEKSTKKEIEKGKLDLEPASPEEYFYAIKNKILKNLSIPKKESRISKGDRVRVSFSLYSGGNLAFKPKVVESTNNYFNKIAVEAIKKAAPFPPFPVSVKDSKKEFTLNIMYEKE